MAAVHPLAFPPTTARGLLNYTLTSTSYPTTLLICSPRAAFLSSLLSSASTSSSSQLLTPTLHLLSVSPHIQVIYTPTLSHLRAWLSIADSECAAPPPCFPPASRPAADVCSKHDNGRSQLVVWGLVKMHKGTSEWSVQGLGSTAAALIDAGQRMGRRIILAEEAESEVTWSEGQPTEGDEAIEEHEGSQGVVSLDEDRGPGSHSPIGQNQRKLDGIYHKRLPMLNGSSRADSNDAEGEAWSGRSVDVGIVLKRWFKFTDEEMLP